MLLMITGLAVWSYLHFMPALAGAYRARLISSWGENQYKAVFSLLLVASILAIIFGWRSTVPVLVYAPPEWGSSVAKLLIFIAFILFAAASVKTNIKRLVRHPQLSGMVIWSIAHLLANGDSRSMVLFGALGLWAVAEKILINRRDGIWVKPAPATIKSELLVAVIGTVMFVVFFLLHPYLSGVTLGRL